MNHAASQERQVMRVLQCWDDGVTSDVRLTEILRRHGAKASFNLNPGLHGPVRGHSWIYRGTEVLRLARAELTSVYDGFTIANHTVSHPHLEQLEPDQARQQIVEGRDRLQQWFGQPVSGFAYPFGTYNPTVQRLVREAGHVYARTVGKTDHPIPPTDAMALHPNCHVHDPDFWTRYEQARAGGVFYFWGHSYEMIGEDLWSAFEEKIQRISRDPAACWGDIPAVVTGT